MKIKFYIAIIISLLLLGLLSPLIIIPARHAQSAHSLARVQADFKAIEKACMSYYVDMSAPFPPDTSLRRAQDLSIPLTFEWDRPYWQQRTQPGGYPVAMLTTPVAYLPVIPRDPFAHGAPYGYFTMGRWPSLALLHSVGPDGRSALDLAQTQHFFQKLLEISPPPRGQELSPYAWGAICQAIDRNQYDPTNGATSRGDLFAILGLSGHIVYQDGKSNGFVGTARAPRFSVNLDPPPLPPGWTAGDPIPPPACFIEELWSEYRPPIPLSLKLDLTRAGFLESRYDGTNYRETVIFKPEKLAECQARLTPFNAFFDHPAALTPAQATELEDWSSADIAFWQALEQLALFRGHTANNNYPTATSITGHELYASVFLLGKCLMLKAAHLAAAGDLTLARAESEAVHSLAMILKDARKGRPFPCYERIESELERMSTGLATWLITQKP